MKQKAEYESIKAYADDLINQVIDEDDLEMTVEKAVDSLTDFINRSQWVNALNKLLNKQEQDLDIADYSGVGNDRGNKDELKVTFEKLQRVLGI